ncbi:MAG TPA: hypothetical protein VI300_15760 [Solirubrobacter sp.]
MLRVTVAVLALIAALIGGSPAAFAQAPEPTVSTTYGSATPAYLSGTESPRSGAGPTVIKDGFGLNPPTLMADPGSAVTITLTDDADALVASLGTAPFPVAQSGEHTYTVTVPGDAVLPQSLEFRVESSSERTLLTDSWVLILGAQPPPPPVAPPTPAAAPQPPALAGSARVRGARLAVAVTCPATAPAACAGTLTLKTSGVRVARLPFAGVAPGASTTLHAKLSSSTRRHLRRHRVRTLRAVLTPAGGPPISSLLELR